MADTYTFRMILKAIVPFNDGTIFTMAAICYHYGKHQSLDLFNFYCRSHNIRRKYASKYYQMARKTLIKNYSPTVLISLYQTISDETFARIHTLCEEYNVLKSDELLNSLLCNDSNFDVINIFDKQFVSSDEVNFDDMDDDNYASDYTSRDLAKREARLARQSVRKNKPRVTKEITPPEKKGKVVFVESQTGSGKTTVVKKVCRECRRDGVKIVILTSRKSLVDMFSKLFPDFHHYADLKEQEVSIEGLDAIVQIDSLHGLMQSFPPPKRREDSPPLVMATRKRYAVIIDEINSFTFHLTNNMTHMSKYRLCIIYCLAQLINNSEFTICLDAWISGVCSNFMRMICPLKKFILHRNVYCQTHPQDVTMYANKHTMIAHMCETIANGGLIYFCCDKKKELIEIREYLKREFKDFQNRYLEYSSDTNTKIDTDTWVGKHILVSPSIVYGVDDSDPNRRVTYACYNNNIFSVDACMQQIFRVRHPISIHIYVGTPEFPYIYNELVEVESNFCHRRLDGGLLLFGYDEIIPVVKRLFTEVEFVNSKRCDIIKLIEPAMREKGFTNIHHNTQVTKKKMAAMIETVEVPPEFSIDERGRLSRLRIRPSVFRNFLDSHPDIKSIVYPFIADAKKFLQVEIYYELKRYQRCGTHAENLLKHNLDSNIDVSYGKNNSQEYLYYALHHLHTALNIGWLEFDYVHDVLDKKPSARAQWVDRTVFDNVYHAIGCRDKRLTNTFEGAYKLLMRAYASSRLIKDLTISRRVKRDGKYHYIVTLDSDVIANLDVLRTLAFTND